MGLKIHVKMSTIDGADTVATNRTSNIQCGYGEFVLFYNLMGIACVVIQRDVDAWIG